MNRGKISARLAPRSSWRAVDFGTHLYRRCWRQTTLVWLLFTAVPFALLGGYAAATRAFWPLLLFWWLKPLWERPLLAFHGRALFGDPPGPLALLRDFPRYGLNGLAAQLTWRRLSPLRGFLTGVWQLEGTRGSKVSARVSVMLRHPGQRAGTLTMIMLALEHALTLALMLLALTLLPWRFHLLEWNVWLDEQSHLHWLLANLSWYLVLTVTEPLYVAASFALYLNQRTWLEGWDLQQGLARIGERRRRAGAAGGALALLVMALAAAPSAVEAVETTGQAEPKQDAVELLASDTFMPFETRQERRLRESLRDHDNDTWWRALLQYLLDREPRRKQPPLSVPDALVSGLGYTLLTVLLVLIVMMVRRRARGGPARARGGGSAPPVVNVAGVAVDTADPATDLARRCQQHLERGEVRAALALLLHDGLALSRYALPQHSPTQPLAPGATEQDYLRAYQRALGDAEAARWLARLIEAWTRAAWAHRPDQPERVRALLTEWLALRPALAAAAAREGRQ